MAENTLRKSIFQNTTLPASEKAVGEGEFWRNEQKTMQNINGGSFLNLENARRSKR